MKTNKLTAVLLSMVVPFVSLVADDDFKYDYIIVGNGTAGAVLARKLSDQHHKKVLVVEAGINHDDDEQILNVDFDDLAFTFTEFWNLTNQPQYAETYSVEVFHPLQHDVYAEGKGWGGSSLNNYTVAVRGTPWFYDQVAEMSGSNQWSYDAMLPLMRALENYSTCSTPINLAQRGQGGPINISLTNFPAAPDPYFNALAAAGNFNLGTIADYNDPTSTSSIGNHPGLGVSNSQSFVSLDTPCGFNGIRSYSSRAFLPTSVVTPSGKGIDRLLDIRSDCYVTRVIMVNNKAKGVEFVYGKNGNRTGKAYAHTTILCAGAVNSPAILQRSGIGDPKVLQPLGIKVLINNPNVGINGQCHYGAQGTVLLASSTVTSLFSNLSASPALPPPYDYPNDDMRRIQIDAVPVAPGVTYFNLYMTEPESEVTVQIVDRNPLTQPLVSLNPYTDVSSATPYLINGSDANKTLTGLKILEGAVLAAGGTMIAPPSGLTDPQLYAYATSADGFLVAYHLVGTTRMAQSIKDGVVDGNLWVHGAEHLMVADIGVLPLSPDGNTAYEAYLVGLRAATILGRDVPPAL